MKLLVVIIECVMRYYGAEIRFISNLPHRWSSGGIKGGMGAIQSNSFPLPVRRQNGQKAANFGQIWIFASQTGNFTPSMPLTKKKIWYRHCDGDSKLPKLLPHMPTTRIMRSFKLTFTLSSIRFNSVRIKKIKEVVPQTTRLLFLPKILVVLKLLSFRNPKQLYLRPMKWNEC